MYLRYDDPALAEKEIGEAYEGKVRVLSQFYQYKDFVGIDFCKTT